MSLYLRFLLEPRNDFSPLLLSLDPAELAKQLTLVEHKKYSLIAPTELMMTNWKKKDRKTVSKRVCILIEWFNKVSVPYNAIASID